MILFVLLAFLAAKIRKLRIAPIWKDLSLYPFFAVECVYWVFQGFAFTGNYSLLPYSKYLQSAFLLSMLFPVLRHRLYGRAIIGAAMVAAGTALNRLVISANAGRMPVWPTLTRLTGYFNPQALTQGFDSTHALMGKDTVLNVLGDYIDVGYSIMSPGDLLIHGFTAIIVYGVIKRLNEGTRGRRLRMDKVQLFAAEWLLGYFLQCGGYICGICAVAKKRIGLVPFLISSIVFMIATYLVRTLGNFNFGIHTMLILLIVNVICVIFLKIDVRHSVLGSLLVTILVLAGEVINYSLLMVFFDQAQITANMTQPLFKAWAGVPGNVILGTVVTIAYITRSVKGKKTDGKAD